MLKPYTESTPMPPSFHATTPSCPRCGSGELTPATDGACSLVNGQLVGGTAIKLCSACLSNGRRIVVQT